MSEFEAWLLHRCLVWPSRLGNHFDLNVLLGLLYHMCGVAACVNDLVLNSLRHLSRGVESFYYQGALPNLDRLDLW